MGLIAETNIERLLLLLLLPLWFLPPYIVIFVPDITRIAQTAIVINREKWTNEHEEEYTVRRRLRLRSPPIVPPVIVLLVLLLLSG